MSTSNEQNADTETVEPLDINGIISRDALGWWIISVDDTIKEVKENGDPENLWQDGDLDRMEQILVLCNGIFNHEFEVRKVE